MDEGLQIAGVPPTSGERAEAAAGPASNAVTCLSLRSQLQRVRQDTERAAIAQALGRTGWNRMAAARLLQISYRSILYKIVQYRMTPPRPPLASRSAPPCSPRTSHPPDR